MNARRMLLLAAVSLVADGCAGFNPVADAVDNYDYKQDVKAYRRNGMSQYQAERRAYDDDFFRKMDEWNQ